MSSSEDTSGLADLNTRCYMIDIPPVGLFDLDAAAWIWSISPQTMPMTIKHILSPAERVRPRTIRAMNAQRTTQVHSTSKCALSLVPLRYLPTMRLCEYFLMDVLSLWCVCACVRSHCLIDTHTLAALMILLNCTNSWFQNTR